MREYNLLNEYPNSLNHRLVGDNLRTIEHRIISTYRDQNFFDGDRNYGYGGYKYDGRWKKIADKICSDYNLNNESTILQLGCEKGFLLFDLKNKFQDMEVFGLETSNYAISNSLPEIKNNISKCENYTKFEFEDNKFNFIIALGVVYTHNLTDIIKCIKEIERVGMGKSFINLASYEDKNDFWLFKQWSLLGTTILKKEEWEEVLKHCNYSGDYYFTNAKSLNLKSIDS